MVSGMEIAKQTTIDITAFYYNSSWGKLVPIKIALKNLTIKIYNLNIG